MRARGLRLAQSPNGIDEAALPTPERPQRPAPTTLPSWRLESALGSAMGWRSFGEAYEFRLVAGAPFTELGPATVWGRLKLPLLAGQEIHPLDRALTLADFPNGIGTSVASDRFAYITPALPVALPRLPTSARVVLDAESPDPSPGHGPAHGHHRA